MARNEHLILKTNFRGPFDSSKYDQVVVATGMRSRLIKKTVTRTFRMFLGV